MELCQAAVLLQRPLLNLALIFSRNQHGIWSGRLQLEISSANEMQTGLGVSSHRGMHILCCFDAAQLTPIPFARLPTAVAIKCQPSDQYSGALGVSILGFYLAAGGSNICDSVCVLARYVSFGVDSPKPARFSLPSLTGGNMNPDIKLHRKVKYTIIDQLGTVCDIYVVGHGAEP